MGWRYPIDGVEPSAIRPAMTECLAAFDSTVDGGADCGDGGRCLADDAL